MSRATLPLLVLFVAVRAAIAQCPGAWAAGFGTPGIGGYALCLEVFNDGSGPVVCVGGRFGTAGNIVAANVARWNGSAWTAFGAGFNHGVYPPGNMTQVSDLVVYDSGTGPALHAAGHFPVSGSTWLNHVARWDGSSWAPLGTGLSSGSGTAWASSLAVFDDGTGPALFVGGSFQTAGGISAEGVARWNGSTWSAVGAIPAGSMFSRLLVHDDGSGPRLYAVARIAWGPSIVHRWNGSMWTQVGSLMSAGVNFAQALVVFDDGTGLKLYTGGGLWTAPVPTAATVARWDGLAWTPLGSNLGPGAVTCLGVHDGGSGSVLYACVELPGGTAFSLWWWDGTGWQPHPSPSLGRVLDLKSIDLGGGAALFAAGAFADAGGLRATGVALWNGVGWTPLADPGPGGFDQVVETVEACDLGTGPAFYAGGNFSSAGVVPVSSIARLDGQIWSPLGSGPAVPNPDPQAIRVFDDGSGPKLWVGGTASPPGSPEFGFVQAWAGSAWLPSVHVFDMKVLDLEVFDDGGGASLYAAGAFTTAGGTPANRIARWTGSSWTPVGQGIGPGGLAQVSDLEVFVDGTGPALYAAGSFYSAGGIPASSVARWDGTAWSPVGSGAWNIRSLAAHDDGSGPALYAGGEFLAGTCLCSLVARWDGLSWSPVGPASFPATAVRVLRSVDLGQGRRLVLGSTGDVVAPLAPCLWQWDGVAWTGINGLGNVYHGQNTSLVAWALASLDEPGVTSLAVGGGFALAGGSHSGNFAMLRIPRLHLALSQPGGPGAGVVVTDTGLVPGRDYANVFSAEPCALGVGLGPYLGLCASDVGFLLAQLMAPAGAVPFRFVATGASAAFGPYPAGAGLMIDGICLDLTGGSMGCTSPVTRYVVH